MFERLNESARAAIVEAEEIAVKLNSRSIDVGHLLYGLAESHEDTAGKPLNDHGITASAVRQLLPRSNADLSEGVDAESLRTIGIDYEGVRAAVEKTFGEGALESAADRRGGDAITRRPRFTIEAKKALEQALRVSSELHNKDIRPGHLLLGLLRVDDDFVSDVIARSTTSIAGLSSSVFAALARPTEY
jgi:ATP-dependent Clp protease ATP-binding subunit ClpA